jgi:hypothetical protein
MHGAITPSDDIDECKWFDVNDGLINNLVDEHKILFKSLIKNINRIKNG